MLSNLIIISFDTNYLFFLEICNIIINNEQRRSRIIRFQNAFFLTYGKIIRLMRGAKNRKKEDLHE